MLSGFGPLSVSCCYSVKIYNARSLRCLDTWNTGLKREKWVAMSTKLMLEFNNNKNNQLFFELYQEVNVYVREPMLLRFYML